MSERTSFGPQAGRGVPSTLVVTGIAPASIGAVAATQGVGLVGALVAVLASIVPAIVGSRAFVSWVEGRRAKMLLNAVSELPGLDDAGRRELYTIVVRRETAAETETSRPEIAAGRTDSEA